MNEDKEPEKDNQPLEDYEDKKREAENTDEKEAKKQRVLAGKTTVCQSWRSFRACRSLRLCSWNT